MVREMEIRNYSPRTIKTYISLLVRISQYYKQCPSQLSADQLKDYLGYLVRVKGQSIASINQTISAVKILVQDVAGRPWEEVKIKRPRKSHYLPDVLSLEEVMSMLEHTPNIKHKTILAVLYSAGVRRDELLQLKPRDIDSKRMMIRVRSGKGNKSRDTLLANNTLALLRKYFSMAHPRPTVYLFEGFKAGVPYSATSVSNIVKRAVKRAGISKDIHVHSLRHAFATHLLEQGANLKVIQKLLGHTSLRSTMVYLHLARVDSTTVQSPIDQTSLAL